MYFKSTTTMVYYACLGSHTSSTADKSDWTVSAKKIVGPYSQKTCSAHTIQLGAPMFTYVNVHADQQNGSKKKTVFALQH